MMGLGSRDRSRRHRADLGLRLGDDAKVTHARSGIGISLPEAPSSPTAFAPSVLQSRMAAATLRDPDQVSARPPTLAPHNPLEP